MRTRFCATFEMGLGPIIIDDDNDDDDDAGRTAARPQADATDAERVRRLATLCHRPTTVPRQRAGGTPRLERTVGRVGSRYLLRVLEAFRFVNVERGQNQRRA